VKSPKQLTGALTFKPLRETDIPLLHRWLNTPHVSEWWALDGNHTPSCEEVELHYLPRVLKAEKVDCFIIEYEHRPSG
jgi:aminoglycoside 6'-N-acetyltransferase-1b/aminoglycoside 6'-N-acetyltransferase-2